MTNRGKRELVEAIRPRYLQASKTEKNRILNEFVAVTGTIGNMPFGCSKTGISRKGMRGGDPPYQQKIFFHLMRAYAIPIHRFVALGPSAEIGHNAWRLDYVA